MSKSGFLYFCPVNSVHDIPDNVFNDFPHLKDNIGGVRNVIGSPEGTQGIIFTQKDCEIEVAYKPSFQNWKKSGPLWICFSGTPSEKDFRKKWQGFTYSHVQLSDSEDYRIIVTKAFDNEIKLPQKIGLDDEGELEKGDIVDYATPFYAVAEKYSNRITVDEDYISVTGSGEKNSLTDLEIKELFHDCAFILSGLYNLGKYEISYLELFTMENMQRIIGALCDYLLLQEAMKNELYRTFIEENYREKIEVARRLDIPEDCV